MKIYFSVRNALLGILILLQVVSCKKENNNATQYPIPANLMLLSSGYAAGASTKVEIYAANNLFVGYNKLYIALYDSAANLRITQAQISLNAMMNKGADMCPSGLAENPSATPDNNGLFDGAVIFTGASGNWTLTVQVQNLPNQKAGSFGNLVNVVQSSPARAYSVIPQNDSTNLFVSLVQPFNPIVGVNSFELTIDKQVNAMNLAPDSSYTVLINAEMPSMSGMNSPNNVNPLYTANGHYTGKVDFIMSGAWQINISLMHNGAVADSSHYFALSI